MKKNKKKYAIFTLLVMLCNFFVSPLLTIADARTITALEAKNLIVECLEEIDDSLKSSKKDQKYNTDNSYTSAVLSLEELYNEYEDSYDEIETTLNSLTFSKLVATSYDTDLITAYDSYINAGNNDFSVDLNDIETITYDSDPLTEGIQEATLITEFEYNHFIINNYLIDLLRKTSDFSTLYDLYKNNYIDSYNSFILNDVNPLLENIDIYYTNITQYECNEKQMGNNPNILVNNKNIYTLINDAKTSIENKTKIVHNKNISTTKTLIDKIYNDIKNKIDEFFSNNKNYLELGLDNEIEELTLDYNNAYTSINDLYTSMSLDYNTINYNTLSPLVNSEFINIYKNTIDLENNYQNLKTKINKYIQRKPSDKTTLDNMLSNLNTIYQKINKTKLITELQNIVSSSDLTNEDNVDRLYEIKNLDVNKTTKNSLINAKKSFYELKFTDSNYRIKNNYIIINNKKEIPNDIERLINYNYNFEYICNNEKCTIDIYDRNDWLINTYDIILSGDLNNDRTIDNKDLSILQNLIVKNKSKKEQKIIGDVNNDNKINIKDLSLLKTLIDNKQLSEGTKASFKIVKEEQNNTIKYKIYLKSNGTINALSSNIKISKDLTFKKMLTNKNIILNNKNNPTLFVGYGSFNNGDLLMTIVYEKNNNYQNYTTFEISNASLVFDNNSDISNIVLKDIKKNEQIKEETKQEEKNVVQEITLVKKTNTKETPNKTVTVEDLSDEDKIDWKSIIKIVVVVLLGSLIIYFLNKDEEEIPFEENNENKKE